MTAPRTRLVFRVETPEGRGPYNCAGHEVTVEEQDLATEIAWAHSDWDHPPPNRDGIGWIRDEEVCGFTARHKAREWFAEWADVLDEQGFVLSVYRVAADRIRAGFRQAVFEIDAATHVKSIPLARALA